MPADRRRWHTLCLLRLLPHMSVSWAAPAGSLKYAKQREIGLGYGKAPLQFNHPSAISTLPSTGDLVITDSWNHRLQVVSPRGTSRLACGKFGVGKGQFWQPASVVANEKSVFIADTQNHRIQKLRADNFSTLRSVGHAGPVRAVRVGHGWVELRAPRPRPCAGSFGDGPAQMNMPKGLGLLNGTLYVVDSHNSRVLMFTAYELRYIGSFGSRGIEPGRMSHPEGLCIWNGEVFVADSGNDRIQVFNERGVLKRWFRVPGLSAGHVLMPTALSAADDRMYVLGETDGEDGRMLQVINATGSLLQTITVGGTLGAWGRLSHVLVTKQSSSQRLYAVDSDWHRVHVFTIRHERERTHSGTWEKSKERNTHHNVGKH